VIFMLSEQDRRALADIERGLRADFPSPSRRTATLLRVLLCALTAAACVVATSIPGWPSALALGAVTVGLAAGELMIRHRRRGAAQ